MGRKRRGRRGARGDFNDGAEAGDPVPARRPEKLNGVAFEDFASADAVFRAALASGIPSSAAVVKEVDREPPAAVAPATGRGSRRSSAAIAIDLHGLTAAEAAATIERIIRTHLVDLPRGSLLTFKVITGKGRHSGPGGPVLPRSVHAFLLARFGHLVQRIDEAPADVALSGLPVRGHFHVTIGRR